MELLGTVAFQISHGVLPMKRRRVQCGCSVNRISCAACLSMKSDDKPWTVDVGARLVRHESGLTITFEGIPESTYFAGSPKNMPRDMTALKIATLIREGFEEFRNAYAKREERRPVLMLKSR